MSARFASLMVATANAFQVMNPAAEQNAVTVNIGASGTASFASANMTTDTADIY